MTDCVAELAAAPQMDQQAMHAALHNLKGVASIVGAQHLADLAAQAERTNTVVWVNPQDGTDWVAVLTIAGLQAAAAATDLAERLTRGVTAP